MSISKNVGDVSRIIIEGAGDVVEEVADAGRKAYCQQYTSNPYWVMVKNNLILPIVTRTLNNFCSDFPAPPPPPPPPFTGGQCAGVQYTFIPTILNLNSSQTEPQERSINLITVVGRVDRVDYTTTSSNQIIDFEIYLNDNPSPVIARWNLGSNNVIVGEPLSYEFVKKDGTPDVCGDPPSPGYPPTAPPTDNDLTSTVNITNNAGDSYDYSVTINRDTTGTIVFPPTMSVNTIGVTIDIGGVTISNTTNKNSGGGNGGEGGAVAPEPVAKEPELVEELKEPEEVPPPVTVEKLVAIIVSLAAIPVNADVVDGRGAPDVYYAGWVTFKNGATYYERQFINFNNQRFQAPEENDGYAVTYKPGFQGQITEITEETVE